MRANEKSPSIVVGMWRGRYLRFRGQQFVFLAAPARSGKGVGVVIPNLLTYQDSVVVLDIKRENYVISAGFRRAHGQEVYLFDPFAEDARTHRYNPLSAISEGLLRVSDILALAHALYPTHGHDDFWKEHARNLFLGIVLLLCEWRDARQAGSLDPIPHYPVTLGEVLRQSSGNGMPVRTYLQRALVEHRDLLSVQCVDALNRFLSNDDKVLASVLATFHASLTIWANPIVDAATSENDFDLRDVRRRRMSIYIGVTPDHLAEAALLVNLVFSQLVNLNTKQLPEADPTLRFQCLLLLDEMTAIGKIHILARAVAYIAGYNLRLLSVVQSVAQLESVYGRADARTYLTNHAMQILFAPREQRDANDYSEMLGTFTDKARSVSRASGAFNARGGTSESVSEQRRPLLLPQELKELGREKEIIVLENTKPILADKICYWRDAALASRVLRAPTVAAMDVERFGARQQAQRAKVALEASSPGNADTAAEYSNESEPSEDEVMRYVEQHFPRLGAAAANGAGSKRTTRGKMTQRADKPRATSRKAQSVASNADNDP